MSDVCSLKSDIAASFQEAVVDMLIDRVIKGMDLKNVEGIVAAGGVAANTALRNRLSGVAKGKKKKFYCKFLLELCLSLSVCPQYFLLNQIPHVLQKPAD